MSSMVADKKPGIFKKMKLKAAAVLNGVSNDLTTDAVPDRSHQIESKPDMPSDNFTSLNENSGDYNSNDLKRRHSPVVPQYEKDYDDDEDDSKALKEYAKKKSFFKNPFKNKKDKFDKSNYNYTATSNVYNVTGNGIHIGPSYTQEIKFNGTKNNEKKRTVNVTQEIRDIMDNNEPLTKDHLMIVSPVIGDNWKIAGRILGYCDGQLEQIQADNPYQKERVYQMLLDWTRNDPDRAILSTLCKVLWKAGEEQAVEKLSMFVYKIDKKEDYDDTEKFDVS